MFRRIMTSFCICLQGTVFERRPKHAFKDRHDLWYYSMEGRENAPPYLLVADEFKVRNDLITKLHGRDGQLLATRDSSKRGRAKWLPDMYEQYYSCTNEPTAGDPRVEVYYSSLGLGLTREPRTI